MGLIYLAKNKTNGHMYIGKTTYSLETRKRGHLYDATTRLRNTAFCNAIRVYGIDGFDWIVLEDNIADKDLNRKEQQYIAQYNTYLDKQHYNMTEGGEGFVPSDEIKQKISKANKGRKWTDEQKRVMSEYRKGNQHSNETKEKMSDSAKQCWNQERKELMSEKMKGKPKSDEHKHKLSEAKIKKETIIAESNNNVIMFSDRKEAYNYCVEHGLANGSYKAFTNSIRDSIKKQQNRYGFKWRIEESNVETKESSKQE